MSSVKIGEGFDCPYWGYIRSPGTVGALRGLRRRHSVALLAALQQALAASVGCVGRWTHRSKRGCFPLPLFSQRAWVNPIEGQTPQQGQENRCRGNDQGRQGKEWLHSGAHRLLSQHRLGGSLKPEGVPPPHGSGYPARDDHVDSPTTVCGVLLQGFPTRTAPAHAIGCGALDMGKRIDGAEAGTWDSPGIPHSHGPALVFGYHPLLGCPCNSGFL